MKARTQKAARSARELRLGRRAQLLELYLETTQLVIRQILHVDELVARLRNRANQLIELELGDLRVAVLSVLDEEHHEERHDRRARVDRELPGVGVVKQWSREGPCLNE